MRIFVRFWRLIFVLCSLVYPIMSFATEGAQPQCPNIKTTIQSPCSSSFADIVEPLVPAVVNIYTAQYTKKHQNLHKSPFPESSPFEQFNELFEQFHAPFNFDETYSSPKATSLGSGFIIDQAGFIVTNHHVIANADEIHVKLPDNTELPAKLIGSDPKTDLALLKVEPKAELPFVKFGDSSKARVGDWVITIGNPFGLGSTVTTGIISSKGRDIDVNSSSIIDDFIQTDAAINSGNSGGPMFNIAGEVIGVNTAIFSPSGTNIGIGFAIPSVTAQGIIEQLKKVGKVSRGRLDVTIQEVTPEIAEGLGLKESVGALVVDVQKDGAGDKSGIKSGDVIIEFAGQQVKNSRKLQILIAETPVGQDTKLVIIRNGEKIDLTCKILELGDKDNNKSQNIHPEKKEDKKAHLVEKNGITYSNLTPELRRQFSIKDDLDGIVVVSISTKHKMNALKVGDLVTAINQQRLSNIDQLNKMYENAKNTKKQHMILFVKRRGLNIFVAMPVE